MTRPDLYDVMALVGLAALGAGLALVSLALALMVVGGLVMVAGVYGSAMKGRRYGRERQMPGE